MGIKRMNKFLDCKNLIKLHYNLNDMIRNSKKENFKVFNTRNKCYRLAIDTMLYAHKFKYSYDDILYGFVNQIINFLNNKILPIYVIDGTAPDEKMELIRSRNEKKNKIDTKIDNLKNLLLNENDEKKKKIIQNKIKNLNRSNIKITKNDIDNIINLLTEFKIPFIRAKGEADALIGVLYENNYIDACLSEDMDILVFGCKKMIKFYNKKILEYDLDFILEELNLSFDKYLEMCIYFGCDYLKPILRIDTNEIYNYIKNNSINDIIKSKLDDVSYEKYLKKFESAKEIFYNSRKLEKSNYVYFSLKANININNLLRFIKNNCKINSYKLNDIQYELQYINGLINDNKFC